MNIKKSHSIFLSLALVAAVGQTYNFNADPSAEPRPFGFGEPAGKSEFAKPFTNSDYPGQSEVVGAKG